MTESGDEEAEKSGEKGSERAKNGGWFTGLTAGFFFLADDLKGKG